MILDHVAVVDAAIPQRLVVILFLFIVGCTGSNIRVLFSPSFKVPRDTAVFDRVDLALSTGRRMERWAWVP